MRKRYKITYMAEGVQDSLCLTSWGISEALQHAYAYLSKEYGITAAQVTCVELVSE